jgi:hypothetical protein
MISLQVTGLFGLIVLFLDIWAIVRLIQSPAGPGVKTIWVLVILFMPILGLLLWFLLGPRD